MSGSVRIFAAVFLSLWAAHFAMACGCRAVREKEAPPAEASLATKEAYREAERLLKSKEFGRAAKLFERIAVTAPNGCKESSEAKERLADIEKTGAKRLREIRKNEKDWNEEKVVAEYRVIAIQFDGLPQADAARARMADLTQGSLNTPQDRP